MAQGDASTVRKWMTACCHYEQYPARPLSLAAAHSAAFPTRRSMSLERRVVAQRILRPCLAMKLPPLVDRQPPRQRMADDAALRPPRNLTQSGVGYLRNTPNE